MQRRDLIGGAAMGGLLGLAGCREILDRADVPGQPAGEKADGTETSSASPTAADSAVFTRPELTLPADVNVGTETTVSFRAYNAGGQAGDLTGTLTRTDGSTSTETAVDLHSVSPGETGTTEVEVTFDTAGTHQLTFEGSPLDESITESVQVGSLVGAPGESIRISDALRVTVSEFRYRNLITYSADLGLGYDNPVVTFVRPPADGVQVIARLTIENFGLEDVTPETLGWTLPDGEFYQKYPETNRSGYQPRGVRTTQHTDGKSLFYSWIESTAEELALFAPFTISRERAAAGVRLGLQMDEQSTPLEYVWSAPEPGVPDLRLREFGPEGDELSRGSDAAYPITVENVGDAPVDLQLVIQYRPEGKTQYPTPVGATYFERDLQPGGTTTWSVTDHPEALGTYDVRVVPFDEETEAATRRLTYTPPTVALGDRADLGVGTMTMSDLRLADGYEQEEPTLSQGQAPNGTQYLFFFVSFVASRSVSSVPADGFYGTVAGERRYSDDRKLRKPDSESSDLQPAVSFDPGASLATGERERGWVGILVPEEATRADIARVGYRGQVEDGDRGASWMV